MVDINILSYRERLANYIRERLEIKTTDPREYEKRIIELAEKWRL